jgi:hypothetical protein
MFHGKEVDWASYPTKMAITENPNLIMKMNIIFTLAFLKPFSHGSMSKKF